MLDTQQPIQTQQEGLKLAGEFFGIDGKSLHEQGGEEREGKRDRKR